MGYAYMPIISLVDLWDEFFVCLFYLLFSFLYSTYKWNNMVLFFSILFLTYISELLPITDTQIENKHLKLNWETEEVKVGRVGMRYITRISSLIIKIYIFRRGLEHLLRVWRKEMGREGTLLPNASLSFINMEEQLPGNHGEKDSQCMKINFERATTENILGNQQEMTKRMCVRKKNQD